MTRYQVFTPEAISDPYGYFAFVSSEVEMAGMLARRFPNLLWEHPDGIFQDAFTMPDFDADGDKSVRGIYPFSDDYVHLVIRRVS
jgi:hypothetical protein